MVQSQAVYSNSHPNTSIQVVIVVWPRTIRLQPDSEPGHIFTFKQAV